MKILHLDSGREMRGGQWQALRLHIGLLKAGHESMLLGPEKSPLLTAAAENNVPHDVVRPLRLGVVSRGYDVVHAHDAHSHTWGAMFSRAPLVVARRVAFPVRTSAASRWKYRRADLFIAVSRYVALELRQAGVDERRIVTVHDGVAVPPEAASGTAILVPASQDPEKGMELALAAARLANIDIAVSQDLGADLPRARALVYLTRSEGLGSGILLGMAHGVTVIASNVGGIPELITDGVNGILVSNHAEAVAGAFRRINPDLGRAARRTVSELFTEERMVRKTIEAYRRLASAA
jgi:glycosyltransferase involved in cell wall biosynthesis